MKLAISLLLCIAAATAEARYPSRGWLEDILGIIAPGYPGGNKNTTTTSDATCGQRYAIDNARSYRIQSPVYGVFPYPPSFSCSYTFLGTDGCSPMLNCSDFQVVESQNCTTDYLEVSDGVGASQRFCGNNGPRNTTTGISIMEVKFQTGVLSSGRGFSCLATCAPEQTDVSQTSITNVIPNALGKPKTTDCTCGIPGKGNRIVGGDNAQPEYWTWQTAMVFRGRNGPFCGGALLNDRFIVTAAHCVVTTGLVAFPALAQVVFNEYDTSMTNETITVRRNIRTITPHPFYDSQTQDYDIAVIEFTPPLNLSTRAEPTLTPVCLPPRNTRDTYITVNGTVIGWGTLTEGGNQAKILQEAKIPIISNEECNKKYDDKIKITPRMICAAYAEGGIDSCQGDSGGPFMVPMATGGTTARFAEVGVVSFGEGCARKDKPGVYARVTDLNDWVRQTAWSGTWCEE